MSLVLMDTCKIQMRMIYAYNKSHVNHVDMKSSHSEMIEIFFWMFLSFTILFSNLDLEEWEKLE